MEKRMFIFFLLLASICNIFPVDSEVVDSSNYISISDLEDLKMDLRRDIAILFAHYMRSSSTSRQAGLDSLELREVLDDMVSLKIIKMLDEIYENKKDAQRGGILRFAWDHKYEVLISTIILVILLSPIDFASSILESSSHSIARGAVHFGKNIVVGTATGIYSGFEELFTSVFG